MAEIASAGGVTPFLAGLVRSVKETPVLLIEKARNMGRILAEAPELLRGLMQLLRTRLESEVPEIGVVDTELLRRRPHAVGRLQIEHLCRASRRH